MPGKDKEGADLERCETHVLVGRLAGVYGVRGWFRVVSYTDPKEALLDYPSWWLRINGDWRGADREAAKAHGKGIVAKLGLANDRDQAAELVGTEIAIERSALTPPGPGEYYWRDLLGLSVTTIAGSRLGTVRGLLETGGHDVLVVQEQDKETLIPFVLDKIVKEVDLNARTISVDWEWD